MHDAETQAWLRRLLPMEAELRDYLRRFLPEPADVADVVQDAYIKMLTLSAGQREQMQSPRSFLFTTAHNAAVDRLRSRRVVSLDSMTEFETSMALMNCGQHLPVPPDRELDTRQELEHLERMLASLPKRCGAVLRLRKVFGYTQKEIAAELGISEHTVEKQLALAVRLCTQYRLEQPASMTPLTSQRVGGRYDAGRRR
jgi:RNA polymerase sigma-70 factor (ECF subfamily)